MKNITHTNAPVKWEDAQKTLPTAATNAAQLNRICANFPTELQRLDQWLCWRFEQRGKGKPTKTPCARDGSRADVTNPTNYMSFEDACNAYQGGGFDGIGFVFTDADPYCGVDLDDCIANGTINPQATRVIEEVQTYAEKSISGTGIHMIARANLPAGGRKSKGHKIEFYDEARFFVVTGDHIPGTPKTIEDRQSEIEQLHERIFPPPLPAAQNRRPPTLVNLDDQTLIDKMFAGKSGAKIRSLWDGNSSAHDDDESAADLALCNALAFWCGRDPQRMDRLFRQSGRMRNKWDRPARSGETYGEGTIRRACLGTQKVYTLPKIKPVASVTPEAEQSTSTQGGGADDNGPYKVIGGRIHMRHYGEDGIRWERLCNFSANITADVMRDDGEEVTRQLAISGRLDNDRVLPEIMIDARDFDSMNWVAVYWGGRPIIQPGQAVKGKLRHAIQVLSADSMAERLIYEHTGWRMINGQRVFLHAGGAIGISGVSGITVELPGRLSGYKFPDDDAVSVVDAARASIELMAVAPYRVTMPLWGMTYYAPLSSMLAPAFLPNAEGPTGSQKTSLTALFCNHFGAAFNEKAMPDDWVSTANSIERNAFLAKDVLFVIDDYRPAESRAEEREQTDKLGRVARSVGNRAARGRLTSGRKTARSYIPRGLVAMTAELGATGRSVVARQFTVTVKPGDVDLGKLTTAQQQRHVYAYAMREYIEWLQANYETIEDTVNRELIKQRSEFAATGMHGRLPDAAAQLYIGFDIALRWATSIGATSEDEVGRLRDGFKAVLRNMAHQQNETVQRENPATKFMTTLITMLVQGDAAILPKTGSDAGATIGSQTGERVGHWEGDTLYIYPPAALRMVSRFISDMGGHFSGDTNTLGRDLKDAGWLVKVGSERRAQVALRVPGYDEDRPYFYALSKKRFDELALAMGFDYTQFYHFPKKEDTNKDNTNTGS